MRRNGGAPEQDSKDHVTEACGEVSWTVGSVCPWSLVGLPEHPPRIYEPSFLLFTIDLKLLALLPPDSLDPTDLGSYREELILSLSSARELAVASIQEAQKSYKNQYNKRVKVVKFRVGDWVFVRYPEEETGKRRKLSRPWYGPFRVITNNTPT